VVLAVEAGDREELLHDWLQAVLVRVQAGFLPCEVEVALAPGGLRGTLRGEPLDPARHRVHGEVKGVTWHGLTVRETPAGVAARVILDV
jgi:SHS2 domain-containing protein